MYHRVAQYAGDPGVLGIIRIVIYLFYYPYFIMTPGPCGLRTTTSDALRTTTSELGAAGGVNPQDLSVRLAAATRCACLRASATAGG